MAAVLLLGSVLGSSSVARASNLGDVVPFIDPLFFPPGQNQGNDLLPPTSSSGSGTPRVPESPLSRVGQNSVPEVGPGRIQDTVDPVQGQLTFLETDLNMDSVGFPLIFTRTYESSSNTLTPFGYGWNFSYHRYIQLYAEFTMTNITGTEAAETLRFTRTIQTFLYPLSITTQRFITRLTKDRIRPVTAAIRPLWCVNRMALMW